jgi:hypothetical protein
VGKLLLNLRCVKTACSSNVGFLPGAGRLAADLAQGYSCNLRLGQPFFTVTLGLKRPQLYHRARLPASPQTSFTIQSFNREERNSAGDNCPLFLPREEQADLRTMLVIASSTARVIDLHCTAENPRVSVRRSTAPRTTESSLGLLYSANINKRPPRCPDLCPRSLFVVGRGKVFMRDMGGLLGEIVGRFEIPAKEADLPVYISV